jgi:hypothetical protein
MNNYDPNFMMVDNIGSTNILNELENNLKSFLDWGFLNAGGFVNVTRPTANISSFNLHILKPIKDKQRLDNTVWQTPRKDWVYETGIQYENSSPIDVSGIYINNIFYPGPSGSGSITYSINYPEGKVYFSNPLPSNSLVAAEYSYRSIQVYKMEEFPYWKGIQYRSLENKNGFSLTDRGDFSIDSEHRIQLPAIIIETAPPNDAKPFRLGDKSLILNQSVLLHILSDNNTQKNNIIDIIRLQQDRFWWLYDTDSVIKDNVYPLNYNGSKNSIGKNYLDIINDSKYRWLKSRITEVSISEVFFPNLRLYGSVLRLINELIILPKSIDNI